MIEDEDMDQPEEIEKNQDMREIELWDLETKDHKNTNKSPIRENAGKGIERLGMNFGDKTYDTQFTTRTGEKKNMLCMACTN